MDMTLHVSIIILSALAADELCRIDIAECRFVAATQAQDKKLTEYEKAVQGLYGKTIKANLPTKQLLLLCTPDAQTRLGPFTVYHYERIAGYDGLTIIAKNDVLVRAVAWSCMSVETYFDEMTSADEKEYRRLRKEHADKE